jgi:hypothetical protein
VAVTVHSPVLSSEARGGVGNQCSSLPRLLGSTLLYLWLPAPSRLFRLSLARTRRSPSNLPQFSSSRCAWRIRTVSAPSSDPTSLRFNAATDRHSRAGRKCHPDIAGGSILVVVWAQIARSRRSLAGVSLNVCQRTSGPSNVQWLRCSQAIVHGSHRQVIARVNASYGTPIADCPLVGSKRGQDRHRMHGPHLLRDMVDTHASI